MGVGVGVGGRSKPAKLGTDARLVLGDLVIELFMNCSVWSLSCL